MLETNSLLLILRWPLGVSVVMHKSLSHTQAESSGVYQKAVTKKQSSPPVCQSISAGDILKWLCDSATSCHSQLSVNKGRGMKPSARSLFPGTTETHSHTLIRTDWIYRSFFFKGTLLNPGHTPCLLSGNLPFLFFYFFSFFFFLCRPTEVLWGHWNDDWFPAKPILETVLGLCDSNHSDGMFVFAHLILWHAHTRTLTHTHPLSLTRTQTLVHMGTYEHVQPKMPLFSLSSFKFIDLQS